LSAPDPRTTLARPDLAAAGLEGMVEAARFARPIAMACPVPATGIRKALGPAAEQLDQLLFGEAFDVLETRDGWSWGQARRDGYVGFVDASALSSPVPAPTHWVKALRTAAFSEPNIKSAPVALLSMNALVAEMAREGRFVQVAGSGWIVERHLAGFGAWETDPASVAERFLDAPYLWGGRDSLGLDCSGLVQQSLYACGRAFPRDTDQQAKQGVGVEAADLRRGDLVFWRGHVAMMLDEARIIHANAYRMAVTIEPLAEAVERTIAGGEGEPTAYRRLG